MQLGDVDALRRAFRAEGYVQVEGLLTPDDVRPVLDEVHAILQHERTELVAPHRIQTQYTRDGRPGITKINQLAESHPLFGALARDPRIWSLLEALAGPGPSVFRDVVIVRPPRSQGVLSYHQDSAYWDVEPPDLVSAWISLTEVDSETAALRIIPGSHHQLRPHGLAVAGVPLAPALVSRLRRLVSAAGTGDRPRPTAAGLAFWKAKRWMLAQATRYAPILGDLQDYHVVPSEQELAKEVRITAKPGDVVFFHSLTLHAAGPNTSNAERCTPIVSYMPAHCHLQAPVPSRRARVGTWF